MLEPSPAIQFTDAADNAIFDTFYNAYEKAFVLPDEMENRDGFRHCLDQNHGIIRQKLLSQFGPYREICVVAFEPDSGTLIGGANFIAMPHPRINNQRYVTANLNYIFIDQAMRRRGWLRPVLKSVRALISTLFDNGDQELRNDVLMFIEQNDPLLMGADAYRRDSQYSGIDQFDRLRIWARQGARIVDFPYVQPPLSTGQKPDGNLVYSVVGAETASITACVLQRHLRTFFGISVLKGEDIDAVPVARSQIEILRSKCMAEESIALIDPTGPLSKLNRDAEKRLIEKQRPSLVAWLKEESALISTDPNARN